MSQMKLAARLQVLGIEMDRSMVTKIEIGTRPISDVEIVAIANILKVQIPWLFEDSKDWFTNLGKK